MYRTFKGVYCFDHGAICEQDVHYEQCEVAEDLKIKPMYAIVKKGIDWSKFKGLPWRKIFFYEKDIEITNAMNEIRQDLKYNFHCAGGV